MEQTYVFEKRPKTGYLPFPGLYAVCEKASGLLIGAISQDWEGYIATFKHNKFIVGTDTKPRIKFFVQHREFYLGVDQETKEGVFLAVLNSYYEEANFFVVPIIKQTKQEEILLLKAYEEYRDQIQDAIPDLFRYCEVKAERPRRGTTKPEL